MAKGFWVEGEGRERRNNRFLFYKCPVFFFFFYQRGNLSTAFEECDGILNSNYISFC